MDTTHEVEQLARRLCKEALIRMGEEDFRAGRLTAADAAAAASATMRAVDRLWREWIPDALQQMRRT